MARCGKIRRCRIGWLILVLFIVQSPSISQSLFESSQSGKHEELVSNYLTLGGFIRSVAYLANNPENDSKFFQSAYGQAGLLLDARAGEWATARAEVRFKYGSEFRETISQMEIREAYVDLWAGPAGFRFGKMITPWGKGSVFNPTDKLTPVDPTVRSPDEDDIYLGTWGLQGRVNLGSSMKLTATWKPIYRSSVMLIDPVPIPEYVKFADPALPGAELEEGSYGLNYDLFSSYLDASLYWFEGYHHWPGITYESFTMDMSTMEPVELNLRETPFRIRMAGADLSVPAGSWIFRAEGSWQMSLENHVNFEYIPFPEVSYAAEIERSGIHLSILSGYHGKHIIDYTRPDAEASLSAGVDQFAQLLQMGVTPTGEEIDEIVKGRIGAFNRLYNYQLEEYYHTVFLVGKLFLWHDQVEVTLPLIHQLTTSEWIIRPGISYIPSDGIKITAGFSGLYGPEDSLYDMVGPSLNAGYFSIKLTF